MTDVVGDGNTDPTDRWPGAAVLNRDASDAGIPQRFVDDQGRHRDAGDQVRSQPGPSYFGAQSKIGIIRAIPDGLVEVRRLVTVGPLWSAAR